MYFYRFSLSSWFISSLSSFIQVWSHWESNMLLAAKLCGLFLRSLVDHKAPEECSFRPVLLHLIIKLLFLTVCFLLRRLTEVWNSLSCCLLTQKGSSGGGSSCLCEGALLNGTKIDRRAGRAAVQLPLFQTSSSPLLFCRGYDLRLWSHLTKEEVKLNEGQYESVFLVLLLWLTFSVKGTVFQS